MALALSTKPECPKYIFTCHTHYSTLLIHSLMLKMELQIIQMQREKWLFEKVFNEVNEVNLFQSALWCFYFVAIAPQV